MVGWLSPRPLPLDNTSDPLSTLFQQDTPSPADTSYRKPMAAPPRCSPITLIITLFLFFLSFFSLLGPCLWHMEVPRLEVDSELQLLVYTTARATPDLSRVCRSSRQHQILNPLIEARDRTRIPMDTSRVLNPLSHNGNSSFSVSIPPP